jgi:hypothetical protein
MSAEAVPAQTVSADTNSNVSQKAKSSPVKAVKAGGKVVTPLESSWSFWFAKRTTKSENFAEGLCCLVNVDSVESFWLYVWLPSCSFGFVFDCIHVYLLSDIFPV